MTPLEEQVEKLARRWEKEADEGELLDEVAYALEGAADELRALLPLEVTDESEARITDEMVEAGAKAIAADRNRGAWGRLPALMKAGYREMSRACLSAALTQPQSEEPSPYAEAFRERVCPVPEFPGIKNRQEDQA